MTKGGDKGKKRFVYDRLRDGGVYLVALIAARGRYDSRKGIGKPASTVLEAITYAYSSPVGIINSAGIYPQ